MGSHPVAVVQYTYTHTNNTENVTKQTIHRTTQKIHRTTQKIHRTTQKLGRVRTVPRLYGFTLAFALQLRKKHGKTSVRVVRHKHTRRIHKLYYQTRIKPYIYIYILIKNRT